MWILRPAASNVNWTVGITSVVARRGKVRWFANCLYLILKVCSTSNSPTQKESRVSLAPKLMTMMSRCRLYRIYNTQVSRLRIVERREDGWDDWLVWVGMSLHWYWYCTWWWPRGTVFFFFFNLECFWFHISHYLASYVYCNYCGLQRLLCFPLYRTTKPLQSAQLVQQQTNTPAYTQEKEKEIRKDNGQSNDHDYM